VAEIDFTICKKIKTVDIYNINLVDLDNSYFLDVFHFNYEVADCIVEKITTGKSNCGSDFGYTIDRYNIDTYIKTIKKVC